jgi:hypothetical protein
MKNQLLKDCIKVMQRPSVAQWHDENLTGKPQVETINSLLHGIASGKLNTHEALSLVLIIGYQWNVKFEGVP